MRRRYALRDGDLPGRPLRCAQTKRTKPAALGSALQVGAPLAGVRPVRPTPPRPVPPVRRRGAPIRRAHSCCAGGAGWGRARGRCGSQLRGTPGSCPAEAGLAAPEQPVGIPGIRRRRNRCSLGTAPASPFALPSDPQPQHRKHIRTTMVTARAGYSAGFIDPTPKDMLTLASFLFAMVSVFCQPSC